MSLGLEKAMEHRDKLLEFDQTRLGCVYSFWWGRGVERRGEREEGERERERRERKREREREKERGREVSQGGCED